MWGDEFERLLDKIPSDCKYVDSDVTNVMGDEVDMTNPNYFNSVDLQRCLLSKGIYSCGTISKGRKKFRISN